MTAQRAVFHCFMVGPYCFALVQMQPQMGVLPAMPRAAKRCVSVPASSRRRCPPHVRGSRSLQNRSVLMCQESSSKSPNPHHSILQLLGLPERSSSNFPPYCPLCRCQEQRWSSGVNPQGLVQSQLQSPESFSLNLKDSD